MAIKDLTRRLQQIEQAQHLTRPRGWIHLCTNGNGTYYMRPAEPVMAMFVSPEQAEAEGWEQYNAQDVEELKRQGWQVLIFQRNIYQPSATSYVAHRQSKAEAG